MKITTISMSARQKGKGYGSCDLRAKGNLEPLPHNGTVEITARIQDNVVKVEVSKQDLIDILAMLP